MAKKILIIEDDRTLLTALQIELKNSKFEVLPARDGKAGLKIAKKKKPDLIMLDLVMPGLHGFEVLKTLKADQKTKNIPVIILSNLAQSGDIKEGLKLGAEAYYVKAFIHLSELSKKVKGFLS